MKKIYLGSSVLFLLLFLVISCNKDLLSFDKLSQESLSIEDARSWFEAAHDPFILFDGGRGAVNQGEVSKREDESIIVTPGWDLAFTSNKKGNKWVT